MKTLFELSAFLYEKIRTHTVGPASRDVPESTIAPHPPAQTPEEIIIGLHH